MSVMLYSPVRSRVTPVQSLNSFVLALCEGSHKHILSLPTSSSYCCLAFYSSVLPSSYFLLITFFPLWTSVLFCVKHFSVGKRITNYARIKTKIGFIIYSFLIFILLSKSKIQSSNNSFIRRH